MNCPECRNELWPVRHESQDKLICQKCGYVGPVNPVINRATMTGQRAKAPAAAGVSRSKYGNRKTEVDGITFDSAREAARYQELKLLESAGEIFALRLQTPWPIKVNHTHICTYISDFDYIRSNGDGGLVVEDAKGMRTPTYRLKKKLVEAIYTFTITEV